MTHRTRRCTPPPTSLACPSTQTVPVGNLQQLSSFSEAAQRRCSASIWLCAEAQRAVNARKAGRSSNLSSYAVVEPSACSAFIEVTRRDGPPPGGLRPSRRYAYRHYGAAHVGAARQIDDGCKDVRRCRWQGMGGLMTARSCGRRPTSPTTQL